jgi:nucleolar pre-ribosomal-associated protein 1
VLTALRNQLTIRTEESSTPPQDDRLLVAQHWLESVPGAQDLFDLWENASQVRSHHLLACNILYRCAASKLPHISHNIGLVSSADPVIITLYISVVWPADH